LPFTGQNKIKIKYIVATIILILSIFTLPAYYIYTAKLENENRVIVIRKFLIIAFAEKKINVRNSGIIHVGVVQVLA